MQTQIDLSGYTGTTEWFRSALNRTVTYTDGVQAFAEQAGAYWFLDILATELPRLCQREEFLSIKMTVADRKAEIVADDGNGNVLWSRAIDYTDCPEGDWAFYMAPGGPEQTLVIMLPSEY